MNINHKIVIDTFFNPPTYFQIAEKVIPWKYTASKLPSIDLKLFELRTILKYPKWLPKMPLGLE